MFQVRLVSFGLIDNRYVFTNTHILIDNGSIDYSTFTVTLRKLSDDEIRSYVRREEPIDCAGSFKVEGLGIALMETMSGEDYTGLIGLPLIKLCDMLRKAGLKIL